MTKCHIYSPYPQSSEHHVIYTWSLKAQLHTTAGCSALWVSLTPNLRAVDLADSRYLSLCPSTLLISTGGSTPLFCLEGVPDLPVAPQDEAGLTTTFQTWPRGWFHVPKDPDFPVPS